jgi:hypothetical protein
MEAGVAGGDVNDIPTALGFKKTVGRTGLRAKFKMADQQLDTVFKLLQNLEYWRASDNLNALPPLRAVRKECISWLMANANAKRASRPHIEALCKAVHDRYLQVLDANFGLSKQAQQVGNTRAGMHAVHDQIRMLRTTGGQATVSGKLQALKDGAGPGRSLDSHYSIERSSGKHMPAAAGEAAKMAYNRAAASGATKLSLEDWVQKVLLPCREDDPVDIFFKDGVSGGHINDLKKDGVKYCTPRERDAYLLNVSGGQVRDAGNADYHTGSKRTAFSGDGWAIYVVDFDNNFYAESHVVNQFHHSSFLAGAPVQAGGEIAVNQGRVVAITNKTGHYKAGAAELKRALQLLQRGGVDLATVAVNDPFKAKGKWVSGIAALASNGDIAAAGGEVPAPAKVPH